MIRYGLLIYGSAAETNFKKMKKHSEESGEQVFPKKVDSFKETIKKHKVLTVFELCV